MAIPSVILPKPSCQRCSFHRILRPVRRGTPKPEQLWSSKYSTNSGTRPRSHLMRQEIRLVWLFDRWGREDHDVQARSSTSLDYTTERTLLWLINNWILLIFFRWVMWDLRRWSSGNRVVLVSRSSASRHGIANVNDAHGSGNVYSTTEVERHSLLSSSNSQSTVKGTSTIGDRMSWCAFLLGRCRCSKESRICAHWMTCNLRSWYIKLT
jgi:hypothetical protein